MIQRKRPTCCVSCAARLGFEAGAGFETDGRFIAKTEAERQSPVIAAGHDAAIDHQQMAGHEAGGV